MQETPHFDLIVIGAGNAGLAAALTAAGLGKRVLVVEKNLYPGGSAASFRRGRFEFEASLHEIACVGTPENPGSVRDFFQDNGIHMEFVTIPELFRSIVTGKDGYDVILPADPGKLPEVLEQAVPGSAAAFKRLIRIIQNIRKASDYFGSGKQNKLTAVLKYRPFLTASAHSLKEVLESIGFSPKAQSILATYWPYLGSAFDEVDALNYLGMLGGYLYTPPAIPKHRSFELSCAIEHRIRELGGEIWYHTKVDRLEYRNGRVCGAWVGDRCIRADEVIANVFPDIVYSQMLPKEAVPEQAVKLTNARDYSLQFYTVYLGMNKGVDELGVRDYTIFINTTPDPVEQYRRMDDPERAPLIATFLNCALPEATPKGTSMAYLTMVRPAGAQDGIDAEHYRKWKEELASCMIRRTEQTLGIEIRPSIEEIEICTPATFARYLGTPYGTPYGYLIRPWDGMTIRMMNRSRESFVPGLSFVGAHGEMGDGYSSTYLSGQKKALALFGGKP